MSSLGNKFALIGLGFIAPRHFAAIKHIGGEVLLTCDIDKTKAIKDLPFYTHYGFLTADPRWKEVDAVVICTPNDTHMEIALWAIRNGKKVICEKPLSIKAEELFRTIGIRDIFCVMQLRYHPIMEELKKMKIKDCELYVKVKRGDDYWNGWKGNEERSGGILFNIGVHYFDALMQIFGNNCHLIEKTVERKDRVEGRLHFYNRSPITFTVAVENTDEGQDRYIKANGVEYRFSNKDNLSFEDLHKKIYEDYMENKGVHPADLIDLTRFIERLKKP